VGRYILKYNNRLLAWNNLIKSYGLPVLYAVSDNGTDRAMCSNDGYTWELIKTLADDSTYQTVVSSGSLVIAGGTTVAFPILPAMYTSSSTWQSMPGLSENYYGSAYGNGRFVISGNADGNTALNSTRYSTNGSTWTAPSSGPSGRVRAVIYSPEDSLFVAVSDTSASPRIASSSDGVSWLLSSGSGLTTLNFATLARNNKTFPDSRYVFATTGTIYYATSWGVTLTSVSTGITGTPASAAYSPTLDLFVVVFVSGTTTVGILQRRVVTSTDAINWTIRDSPIASYRSVTWSSTLGLFIAVGDSGAAMVSSDGINWTAVNVPAQNWKSVIQC
jgi:hypothetical protein